MVTELDKSDFVFCINCLDIDGYRDDGMAEFGAQLLSFIIFAICVLGLSIALIGSGIYAIVLHREMNEDSKIENVMIMGCFAFACGIVDILVLGIVPVLSLLFT